MKLWLFGTALALTVFSAPAQVVMPDQQQGAPSLSTGTVPLTYTGADNRVSVGIDQDGHSQGELLGVFGNNGERAYVGQLWWGYGGAGGIQADYNWLFGTTLEQARRDPESITVAKLSFAIDQDANSNRQANVGFEYERKEFFLNFYLAGKISSPQNAGAVTTQTNTQTSGTDELGNYTQTNTNVTTTALQAQPYNYSVGVHGGHFSDPLTARFNGGLDYSKGKDGANEKRASVSVDKYIGVQGWSVSAMAEHAQTTDPLGKGSSDNRWWAFLRYEFGGGGAFKPQGSATADTAWIDRALHEPVTGHPRTFTTYTTRSTTTTKTIPGEKQYTARFPIARDDTASVAENSLSNGIDVTSNDSDPEGIALKVTAVGAPSHGTAQLAGNLVLYTPTQGYVGTDRFTYTVTSFHGLSATANVNVTVTPVITPPQPGNPVARDDAASTPQGTPVTVNVLANDSDPNGFTLTVTSATNPAHGTSHVNADGSITYTPAPGYNGSDTFSYSIRNGHGGTAKANVVITVLATPPPQPLPPIARDDTASTAYGTPVGIDVLANDTSPSGFFLTVTSVGSPAYGSAQLNPGGSVTYTPPKGFSGTDTFSYSISDGHGGSASANVTVTVQPPGAPVAQSDAARTAFNTPVTIAVLANDSDPTSLPLTVTQVTTPAHGTAVINPDNTVTYTPQSFSGVDSFGYTISNGRATASATVSITVGAAPAPVAVNDRATIPFNKATAINVLANDSDPNSLALSVTQVSAPAHGSAQINGDNTITYTPQPTFTGTDTFTYTISNGHGGTATATVFAVVQPPLPPIAVNDTLSVPFGGTGKVNVLANDSDPNGLPLSVVSVTSPTGKAATVVINADNTVTYTPNVEQSAGPDSFTYTISDGFNTATATVNVTLQAPLPPVANKDSFAIPFDSQTTLDVLANDVDPQGLNLFIVGTTSPAHGTVINNLTSVSYTPGMFSPPGSTLMVPFVGTDTFTYTISNGISPTYSTATVTVTVAPPQPPAAIDDSASVPFGNGATINVVQNDFDAAGLPLTVVAVTPPAQAGLGAMTTIANGTSINYTAPDSGSPTSDSFTYTIRDPYGQTSSAKVTITITTGG
jgi:hypothetical protein